MRTQLTRSKFLVISLLTVILVSCDSFLSTRTGSLDSTDRYGTPTGPVTDTPGSMEMDPLLLEQYGSGKLTEPLNIDYGGLQDIIDLQGSVPVIIRLDIPFTPEGLLTEQEVEQQRQTIQDTQDTLLAALQLLNVTAVKRYSYIPYIAMQVDEPALLELKGSSLVRNVVEDKPEPPSLMDSIPQIGADHAWSDGYTGEGYTIGILDTGVDLDHSFFSGRITDQACFSSTVQTHDSESLCPNGKEKDFSNRAGGAIDPSIAGYDHGTHVAGIAAGQGSDFSGVAKGAHVISVQVFSKFNNSEDCGFSGAPCTMSYQSDQIKALEWIYERRGNIDISSVNMSVAGGKQSDYCDRDPRKTAIDNLRSSYIATVVPSGNDGYTDALSRPACISTAISVGSVTASDRHSSFSNSASFLDLLAPGSSITSSVPGGDFDTKSGTSAASPHVAGAWAVVRQSNPSGNVTEILDRLTETAEAVTNDQNGITTPRIQLDAAVYNEQNTQLIYSEKLSDPWIDASWSAETDFNSIGHIYSGSRSIRVDQDAWGSLSLRNESWTSTVGIKYQRIVFMIYSEEAVDIDLMLENDEGEQFPRVRYGTIAPGEWTQVSVPMSKLNPDGNTVHRIDILESSGEPKTFYVDDLYLTNKPSTSTSKPDPDVIAVFDEELTDPWIDASWSAAIDYANTQQSYEGSRSIRIDQDVWGALSVHYGSWGSTSTINSGDYDYLKLAVYATDESLALDLKLENDDGQSFPQVHYGTVDPGQWTVVTIPMSKLNPEDHDVHRISIRETSGEPRTYYVDRFRFSKGS